jgi:hypothetical protein
VGRFSLVGQFGGDAIGNIAVINQRLAQRWHEVWHESVLYDVSQGACREGGTYVVLIIMNGQENDLGLTASRAELSGCFDSVEAGHRNVHYNQVGIEHVGGIHNFLPILESSNDVEFPFDQPDHNRQELGMIVGQENAWSFQGQFLSLPSTDAGCRQQPRRGRSRWWTGKIDRSRGDF